ncbi:GCN5-related N-acetyltransferase-like protein [Phytophthora sojae]|uniref:GCN5-related N-acetyltransferase-like protein n=1 Tax=Phytophthora sojae (strain P6497) TaxID=1094619 RepID=G4Z7E0_PHYSP|nr:GCN5-related N-acetyltransferase-like protein [Phytophthora sojae]EGZ19648.1 GCN5-related N-acetyltransferase-like protein [Phytophthora sojae]|eukprot:XP_009522365.1 GCN5-related N-acetyltransferase-like protein [Phytophthora sojae]
MTTDTQIKVTFRQYRPEDHAAVTKIFIEGLVVFDKNLDYRYLWGERIRSDLTTDLADIQASHMTLGGNFWIAVATTKGSSRIVGITGLKRVSKAVGEVRRVYVDQTCHRMRVGRKLMAELESWSRQNGIKRIFLTTAASNEKPQAFYAALGYTKTDKVMYAWEKLKYFEISEFVNQL